MSEYIEREALIEIFKRIKNDKTDNFNLFADSLINFINTVPFNADVQEVRHGKWIPYEIDFPMFSDRKIVNYTCSECGRKLIGYSNPKDAPYCHCGAKMDEE